MTKHERITSAIKHMLYCRFLKCMLVNFVSNEGQKCRYLNAYKIRVLLKDRMEYRDQAIIENGKRVGVARLVTPNTIETRTGTFICSGVKKVIERKVIYRWRNVDLTISKKFWSKGLCLKISNKHLNLRIDCESIYPESYSSDTISNIL